MKDETEQVARGIRPIYDLAIVALLAAAIVIVMILLGTAQAQAQGNDFPSITPAAVSCRRGRGVRLLVFLSLAVAKGKASAGDTGLQSGGRYSQGAVHYRLVEFGECAHRHVLQRGSGDMHWSDGRMFQGMCLFACDFEFTAGNDNVLVWSEYVGCGWCFGAHLDVVSISAPNPPVVSDQKKATARAAADALRNSRDLFTFIGLLAAAVGQVPDTIVAGALATIAGRMAEGQDKVAADPWDPDYASPYDGGSWPGPVADWGDDPYLNNMIGTTRAIEFYADFIYVSANRASSCMMAGADCAGWQINSVNYGLWYLGWYLNDAASNLWVVAWEAEQRGSAQRFVDQMRYMEQVLGDTGGVYQQ